MASSLTDFTQIAKRTLYPAMLDEYQAEPVVYPMVCEVITNDLPTYGDKGTSMSGMGRPKVRKDGAPIIQDQIAEGYTWQIAIRLLSRMIRLPERHVEALDAKGLGRAIMSEGQGWGKSFALECDEMVAHIVQKGTLAAGFGSYGGEPFNQHFKGEADPYPGLGYDGVPFFSTAHPLKHTASTTKSNINVSRSLTYANLQSSWTGMTDTAAYDDRGDRIMIRPTHLVVPPALAFTAKTLLQTAGAPGGANNDANVLRGELEPLVWRALTDDSDAWWLCEAGKGIRVYDSGVPQIRTWFDEQTREYCISAEKRFGPGVTNWRYWQSNNKATS